MKTSLQKALALCELEDDELDLVEAKFIDDITKRLERGETISTKQENWLESLHAREITK